MSQPDPFHTIVYALAADWELALPRQLSEEAILNLLEEKISSMISVSPDAFFNLMYRLDIPEHQLHAALKDVGNSTRLLAKLVYERQIRKIQTRIAFRKEADPDEDQDLNW